MKPWYAISWVILILASLALIILVLVAWFVYKHSQKPKRKPKTLLSPLYARRDLETYLDKVFINMPKAQDMPAWIDWVELKHKAMPERYGYLVNFDAIRDRLGMEFKDNQIPKCSYKYDEEVEELNIYEFLKEQDTLLKRYLEASLADSNMELKKAEKEYARAVKEKRQRRKNVYIPNSSTSQVNTIKIFLYIAIGVLLLGIWGILFLLLFNQ